MDAQRNHLRRRQQEIVGLEQVSSHSHATVLSVEWCQGRPCSSSSYLGIGVSAPRNRFFLLQRRSKLRGLPDAMYGHSIVSTPTVRGSICCMNIEGSLRRKKALLRTRRWGPSQRGQRVGNLQCRYNIS